ncbi:MAG: phenylalanine--tRNA ligase subunit alpha [Candidatus Magasanikbacteria bacterium]|nr:phenylalanine--tRNA ligase subunit alpha [Candidatus Magasanikbacteria bacterium]
MDLPTRIEQLKTGALPAIKAVKNKTQLEEWENKLLSRKSGQLTELMKDLKDLSEAARKEAGKLANEVKFQIETALAGKRRELEQSEWSAMIERERVDITQPALPPKERGHFHPNTIIQRELEDLFTSMGFMVLDGPELESDYYNFTALNIPATHPARDMQDTFYIKGHPNWVMRTHTSPVQVRAMQKFGAPLRAIVPGKCYRNEATDPRHEHTFYQLEGLVIDQGITFAQMKGVFQAVADHLYGAGTKIRLMPKYYPFVEPGARGELTCFLCAGKGCRVCNHTGWLEVMPGGMVHPNVLKEGGIDPQQYQGFAFGFGLTRLAMLKYGIEDIRLLESGKLKFLEQF